MNARKKLLNRINQESECDAIIKQAQEMVNPDNQSVNQYAEQVAHQIFLKIVDQVFEDDVSVADDTEII